MSKPTGIKALSLALHVAITAIKNTQQIDTSDDHVVCLCSNIEQGFLNDLTNHDTINVEYGDYLLFHYLHETSMWQVMLQFTEETEVNVGGCKAEYIEVFNMDGELIGRKDTFTNVDLLQQLSNKGSRAINGQRHDL